MLQRIVSQKYRNLDITSGINLYDLNIFIGENGAGKTNLIDLIVFIRNALVIQNDETSDISKLEKAFFQSRKEFLDKTILPPSTLVFEIRFRHPESIIKSLVLNLRLVIRPNNKFDLLDESLYETNSENDDIFHYYDGLSQPYGQALVSVFENYTKDSFKNQVIEKVPPNRLLLESITSLLETVDIVPSKTPIYEIRRFLIEQFSKWQFYNANAMNIKSIREAEPKVGQSDIYVSPSGENLALVLHNLINDSIDFEEEINRAAKAIRPDSQKIRTALTGLLSLTVQWKVSGIAEPFRLDELSDGTVRMLCWATILRSHKLPSLIVIEEPEVGIHPAWLKVLAEWIKLASERTQVIITTHSPDLLDCFTDRLENVYVFNQKQGDPHHFVIDRLSRDRFQSLLDEGWELGDIYRVGDPTLGGWPW
jgi:predicted ATPase